MAADSTTLSALPLFPLGTVLFPAGVLPLQVFEVRYLDMIGNCRRTGQPFGIVALAQGHEVRRAGAVEEQLHAVGTLARLTRVEQPQPGLMLIECRGEQRFQIERCTRLRHGLWIADVRLLAEDAVVAVPDDLRPVAESLQRLLRHSPAHGAAPSSPAIEDARFQDCGWVANRWCELLPLPLATRQRLMALDSPLLRLELVADLLARAGGTPGGV